MMSNSLEQLRTISTLPDCFSDIYDRISNTWEARADEILSDDFIIRTLESCYALKPWLAIVLEAAAQIRADRPLCLLVCLLEAWIAEGGNVGDAAYSQPAGEGLAYDFLHLFPAIPTMPASVASLRNRGVPEDIIAATMEEYDFCVNMCMERMGRPAFDRGRLFWISCVIRNRLIHIGRLKYDLPGQYLQGVRVYQNSAGDIRILADNLHIHRSGRILGSAGHTDEDGSFFAAITEDADSVTGYPATGGIVCAEPVTLSRKEWRLRLSSEDSILRIHIPPGAGFDQETIAASFERAREIFNTCYPDYPYKGFYCSSWLMSSDLQQILKPGANILGFQEFFTLVPCQSSGRLVFSFVFGLSAAIPDDISALPERTSLQRAIKQLYLSGGFIHEGAGFLF